MPKKKRVSEKYVDHATTRFDMFMNAFVYSAFMESERVRSKFRKVVVDKGVLVWKQLKEKSKLMSEEEFKQLLKQYQQVNQLPLSEVEASQKKSSTEITSDVNVNELRPPQVSLPMMSLSFTVADHMSSGFSNEDASSNHNGHTSIVHSPNLCSAFSVFLQPDLVLSSPTNERVTNGQLSGNCSPTFNEEANRDIILPTKRSFDQVDSDEEQDYIQIKKRRITSSLLADTQSPPIISSSLLAEPSNAMSYLISQQPPQPLLTANLFALPMLSSLIHPQLARPDE